jgi:uncharacterized protein
VGQRMLTGVAKKTAGEFFTAVDDVLTGRAPAVPAGPEAAPAGVAGAPAAPEAAPAPGVFRAPEAPAAAGPLDDPFLRGAVFGAVVALLGALVGGLVGRRR